MVLRLKIIILVYYMKYLLLFISTLFFATSHAQNSQIPILETIIADSTIARYLSKYGGTPSSQYVLSVNKGKYLIHDGAVEFHPSNQEKSTGISGTIQKMKVGPANSVVKIYFKGARNFLTKVKLERFHPHGEWRIKSRLIRLKLKDRKKQPGLFYFGFN